jgi:hypothetical protein
MENLIVDKERKGSYLLYNKDGNNWNEIIFKIPKVRTPFGTETYNNKRVINIEFTNKDKDNDVHNFYSQLIGYEEMISKQIQLEDFETYNKEFVSCIRKNGKFLPLIRVNITDNTKIPISGCPAKSYITGEIRLKKIWTWNNRWGLYFDAKSIEVLSDDNKMSVKT